MLLIISPNRNHETVLLAKTAEALGHKVYNQGWRIPKNLLGMPGAVYGEQFFCEAVAEQMKWKLLSNELDWLAKLPETYTNRKIRFMTLAKARSIDEKCFIKPADDKVFPAKIYDSGKELPTDSLLDETPTLVSEILTFTSEYRCFIKDRKVVTACCYWLKTAKMQTEEINKAENYYNNNDAILDFVSNLLNDTEVKCAPGSVIDVARFKKDTYTVIETNPIYASGLYGCEPVAVLDALKAACVSE